LLLDEMKKDITTVRKVIEAYGVKRLNIRGVTKDFEINLHMLPRTLDTLSITFPVRFFLTLKN
jgi:hypothetical protein